jgi:transposase
MDIIHPRCAGLDVHKKTVVACARYVTEDGVVEVLTRSFGTMTADLLDLADWLASLGVSHAAMEATGVYWQPVWHILEDHLELILVNPRDIKQVPGRKTDVKDAQWIAQLLQCGLLSGSFVPPPVIRELRDLTRQRAVLVRQRAAVANRVQKVLEDANIKLGSVASDVLGASGRDMIAALIAGRDDPEELADLARRRLREKRPELVRALRGQVTEHHRFQLGRLMEQVGHLEGQIRRYRDRIAEVMGPAQAPPAAGPEAPPAAGPEAPPVPAEAGARSAEAEAVRRLATIPGVGEASAEVLVAEIGVEMGQFPTAGHLASWAGMCPGNDVSAGRSRSGRTTKGSVWLRTVLVQVAWAASHTKGTTLAAAYRGWAKRLGKKKALVALGHKILKVAYAMLKAGTDYVEHPPQGQIA